MPSNALYTDLSGYYDLMCADIDYQQQSNFVRRIHQIFGNQGKNYLDLACGTGPHVKYFLSYGFKSTGLDINQPMLDIAKQRNPDAEFILHDMSNFSVTEPLDLITCFLYSIHYNANIEKLAECIISAHAALAEGGVFCFNSVASDKIDNRSFVKHTAEHQGSHFTFQSGWNYCGEGQQQHLLLKIEKLEDGVTEVWDDKHPMVAIDFQQLQTLLIPYFDVHLFEHDYEKITPFNNDSGNAIVVCVKK